MKEIRNILHMATTTVAFRNYRIIEVLGKSWARRVLLILSSDAVRHHLTAQ